MSARPFYLPTREERGGGHVRVGGVSPVGVSRLRLGAAAACTDPRQPHLPFAPSRCATGLSGNDAIHDVIDTVGTAGDDTELLARCLLPFRVEGFKRVKAEADG